AFDREGVRVPPPTYPTSTVPGAPGTA
ncbi:MAG: hypothetical protein QOJ60_1123, partial [Actinomycetota bacterium]|nr:hypothetical protein [Actinomycetota bacterium]